MLRRLIPLLALPLLFITTGCEKECGCTLEIRSNFCITVRGSETLPDTLRYVRERLTDSRTGKTILDTLPPENPWSCFHEYTGKQRVLVYSKDSLIHASEWIRVDGVDCCHSEAKTVDLPL